MSDEEHKCHCSHVVVVVHDLRRAERFVWIMIVACIGVLVHAAAGAMGSHVSEVTPEGRPGERMGSDHVPKPEPPGAP